MPSEPSPTPSLRRTIPWCAALILALLALTLDGGAWGTALGQTVPTIGNPTPDNTSSSGGASSGDSSSSTTTTTTTSTTSTTSATQTTLSTTSSTSSTSSSTTTVTTTTTSASASTTSIPTTATLPLPPTGSLQAPLNVPGLGPLTFTLSAPASLLANLPAGQQLSVAFNATPEGLNIVQQGSLGGGVVQPLAGPIDLQALLTSASTKASLPLPDALQASTIHLALPLPPAAQARLQQDPTAQFAWLRELRAGGQFQGYLRIDTHFDPTTGTLTYDAPLSDLTGTLFLPAFIVPAYVQNFDPSLHIWSGPNAGDVDLGEAGPQFTVFTVVAPQIGSRLYVYNPATQNYGWIDVAGVGPSGPSPT